MTPMCFRNGIRYFEVAYGVLTYLSIFHNFP